MVFLSILSPGGLESPPKPVAFSDVFFCFYSTGDVSNMANTGTFRLYRGHSLLRNRRDLWVFKFPTWYILRIGKSFHVDSSGGFQMNINPLNPNRTKKLTLQKNPIPTQPNQPTGWIVLKTLFTVNILVDFPPTFPFLNWCLQPPPSTSSSLPFRWRFMIIGIEAFGMHTKVG